MDYKNCYYKSRFVYDAREYLSAIRENYFFVTYNPRNRTKMLEEIERIINYNSSVDLYAYAHLLYDDKSKSSLDKAYNILDLLVSWDYVPAKYLLGQMYYFGAHIDRDLKKFFQLSKEAADSNFTIAKNALALAYFNGYGCKVDLAKGRECLEECVKAKYGVAYYNTGVGYMQGSLGYPKNPTKALEYFQEASYQHYSSASYNLGLIYLSGKDCVKNVKKGIEELIEAAAFGHVKAQKKLGDIYYFGEITSKNLEKAYSYYLMAAENGDAYSMYSVGYMNLKKEIARSDRYVGLDWLRKASYLGYEGATKMLQNL